jgi:hypothetical protein
MLHMQPNLPERQLLLFYSEPGKALMEKQRKELDSQEAGLKERDVIVKKYPVGSTDEAILKTWKISTSSQFTCILIGRDGGEKFRTSELLSSGKLFAIIDAMPMRRNEKRRSGGSD